MTNNSSDAVASPRPSTADLLPCPWCGGKARMESVDVRWSIGCEEITAEGAVLCYGYQSLTTFATQREALAAWNRRYVPPPHPSSCTCPNAWDRTCPVHGERAAAPDMLTALKAVVRVADRKTDEFDAARAAIAKAEGR